MNTTHTATGLTHSQYTTTLTSHTATGLTHSQLPLSITSFSLYISLSTVSILIIRKSVFSRMLHMLHCENYALAPPPPPPISPSLPPSISCCDSCHSSRRVFVWSRTRPGPIPDNPVQRIRTEPPQLPLLYNQSLRFPLLDTQLRRWSSL